LLFSPKAVLYFEVLVFNRAELRASALMIGRSLHTLLRLVGDDLGLTMLHGMVVEAGIIAGMQVFAHP